MRGVVPAEGMLSASVRVDRRAGVAVRWRVFEARAGAAALYQTRSSPDALGAAAYAASLSLDRAARVPPHRSSIHGRALHILRRQDGPAGTKRPQGKGQCAYGAEPSSGGTARAFVEPRPASCTPRSSPFAKTAHSPQQRVPDGRPGRSWSRSAWRQGVHRSLVASCPLRCSPAP